MLVLLPRHNWFTSSLFSVKSWMTKSAISSELAGREARHSVEMNWRRGLSTTAEKDWKSVSVVAEIWAGFADDMKGSSERVDFLWGEGRGKCRETVLEQLTCSQVLTFSRGEELYWLRLGCMGWDGGMVACELRRSAGCVTAAAGGLDIAANKQTNKIYLRINNTQKQGVS